MRKLMFMLVMLSFTLSLSGCQQNKSGSESGNKLSNDSIAVENVTQTNLAPDFTLPKTDGSELKLSDYRGKIVIIDFWATWCPPCRKGIPDLISIQKEFEKDAVVIGISLDTETKNDVVPFMKKYGVNYPVVYGNAEVVQAFGNIQAIPTAFVVNEKGEIVDTHVGLVDKSVYTNKIKELLKKS